MCCVLVVELPVIELRCHTFGSDHFKVKASVTVADSASLHQMTPAAQKLFASLPPEFQSHLESMNDVSAAIATDRTIRMWKIAAEKVTPLESSLS